jgi:hypothetical protein
MISYELTPASTLRVADQWPRESTLHCDPRRPTLVMFVHPRCPCSRAGLSELAVLASDCGERLRIQVVFVKPSGADELWEQTALWTTAQRIPGALLRRDDNGAEAERFRATTSGETFLFGPDGRRLFHGGLTGSRGHEGENPGRRAIAALVAGAGPRDAVPPECAVFGCRLSNKPALQNPPDCPCDR